jgi:hypothetical protein
MSGAWRVSDREEIDALREARRIARLERSAAAWAVVEQHVNRCRHYGVPEEEWLVDH